MNIINTQIDMLSRVAFALGDLLPEVVFIGGCTTGLFLTDEFTKEQVRYTDDVDLIVHVGSYSEWYSLVEKLRGRGFRESMEEDVICRLMLGNLKVDFMPDDENALSFGNRWYRDAMRSARDYVISELLTIKLVEPVYFVATKLEAYIGRGNGDVLASHDIEDLVNVFNGREEIVAEIQGTEGELRQFISNEIKKLLVDSNFEYVVQNAAGTSKREQLVFSRIEACI